MNMADPLEFKNNTDLISDLIQSEVAPEFLRRFPTLHELAAASLDQLVSIQGIGPSRAKAIKAAYALAVRLKKETYSRKLLDSPGSVADLLQEEAATSYQERAYLVMLDSRNRMLRLEQIATGTLDSVLIHPREVYAPALEARSASVILAHTHPSGDPTPSESDITVTRKLSRSGQILGIPLLDHVIVGRPTPNTGSYYSSMKELGYLYL